MQLPAFQHSWHNIDLLPLATCGLNPAGPDLYDRFYELCDRQNIEIRQAWIDNKRAIGRFIASEIFEKWKLLNNREPRILALCVGRGIAERVWLERGYQVTLHECQTASLKDLSADFPLAPRLIGDIRAIALPRAFDLIVILAGEYFLSRAELQAFLQTARSCISGNGWLILHSVSILSALQACKEAVKGAVRRYRRQSCVFWGYWRTPSEFCRCVRKTNLVLERLYLLDSVNGHLISTERKSWAAWWPTLSCNSALMILQAPGSRASGE